MIIVNIIKNLITIPVSIFCYKRKYLVLPYYPNAVWIEPTNTCNLRCIMCPNSIIEQKNKGFMKMILYKKIIKEIRTFASYIVLCISGESLLHKDFPQMVKIAKNNGLGVYFSTNATVLTPKLSKQILLAGLDWINFSFDGCSKEIYEKVRVGANFEKTLDNVINFLKIKKELGAKTRAELQILVMDEKGERDYQKNIGNFQKNFQDFPLDYLQKRQPSTWGKFLSGTKKYKFRKLGNEFSPCSYLWSSLHILWDGRIVACTSDFFGDNVLGNFPLKSLKQIWNDKPMQNFRQAMISGKYLDYNKNCQSCDSLWEKPIFGFPAGMRGIDAITLSTITGGNFLGIFKKIAKRTSNDFSIEVVKK